MKTFNFLSVLDKVIIMSNLLLITLQKGKNVNVKRSSTSWKWHFQKNSLKWNYRSQKIKNMTRCSAYQCNLLNFKVSHVFGLKIRIQLWSCDYTANFTCCVRKFKLNKQLCHGQLDFPSSSSFWPYKVYLDILFRIDYSFSIL